MSNAYNYVVFIPQANQVKFGMTSNIKRRMAEHRRTALQAGYGDITFAAMPAPAGVVQETERRLCESLKSQTLSGTREWIAGDRSVFRMMAHTTRRLQREYTAFIKEQFHAA